MSQIYRCDRCKKDIISKFPNEDEAGQKRPVMCDEPVCTIRPYNIQFDMFPGPNECCRLFRYANSKFDLCLDCKVKFLDFMDIEKTNVDTTPLVDPKELWAYMCRRDNPECKGNK